MTKHDQSRRTQSARGTTPAGPPRTAGTSARGVRTNGEAVRTIRERSGYGQTEFAAMIGVDRAHLSHIEAGRRNPSPALAKRIAGALKVPLAAILAEVAQ